MLHIFRGKEVFLPSSTLHDLNGLIVLLIFFSLIGQETPFGTFGFISLQGLQEQFCKTEEDCLGSRWLLLKLSIWGSIKSLVNFHICEWWSKTRIQKSKGILHNYFFLNKLKIVDNTPKTKWKIKIKRLWLRLWGPSKMHMPLLSSPDSGSMYPHPRIVPVSLFLTCFKLFILCSVLYIIIFLLFCYCIVGLSIKGSWSHTGIFKLLININVYLWR